MCVCAGGGHMYVCVHNQAVWQLCVQANQVPVCRRLLLLLLSPAAGPD